LFSPIEPVHAERPPTGLVATAFTPRDVAARWQDGFAWRPERCPTARGFDPVCGLEAPFSPAVGDGDNGPAYHRPTAFRVEEDCGTRGNPDQDMITRVRRQAEAISSFMVARELQNGAITQADPYTAFGTSGVVNGYLASPDAEVEAGAWDPLSALGRIEEAARQTALGMDVFIHMPVRMVPLVYPALEQRGNLLYTGTGAKVVADAGYTGAGPLSAGTSEVQSVTITGGPSGGTWTLTHLSQTTAPLPAAAPPALVQDSLEDLDGVNPGDITVTGSPGAHTVTFSADQGNVAQMTADGSGLTGGTTPAVVVATVTPGVAPTATAGDWMYATGPVLVLLGEIQVAQIPVWSENRTLLVAERVMAAAFDPCNLHAIEVDMPAAA